MSAPDELQALADSLRPRVVSTEERVSYRGKLAEMFREKFEELDLAIIDTGESAEFAEAVLEVPNPELDRLSQENNRLAAEVTKLEQDLLVAIDDRDQADSLLDQFAYAVAPVEVIGEHSSGNDPWRNALDLVAPASERDEQQRRAESAEAQLAEAKKKIEDLRSSVRTIADRLTDWCHDDTASKVIAGSIAGDLNALAETRDGTDGR
jgi:chromosome segregation ATPase